MYMRNVKSHFSTKQGVLATHSQLGQVASSSRVITNWPNCHFLSCSAPAVVTHHHPLCFTRVAFWRVISRKSLASSSRENALEYTHTWILHTQPLHDFHLNTLYLIVEIQVNLAWNKTTHGWINSTLQIQLQKDPIGWF